MMVDVTTLLQGVGFGGNAGLNAMLLSVMLPVVMAWVSVVTLSAAAACGLLAVGAGFGPRVGPARVLHLHQG